MCQIGLSPLAVVMVRLAHHDNIGLSLYWDPSQNYYHVEPAKARHAHHDNIGLSLYWDPSQNDCQAERVEARLSVSKPGSAYRSQAEPAEAH